MSIDDFFQPPSAAMTVRSPLVPPDLPQIPEYLVLLFETYPKITLFFACGAFWGDFSYFVYPFLIFFSPAAHFSFSETFKNHVLQYFPIQTRDISLFFFACGAQKDVLAGTPLAEGEGHLNHCSIMKPYHII